MRDGSTLAYGSTRQEDATTLQGSKNNSANIFNS